MQNSARRGLYFISYITFFFIVAGMTSCVGVNDDQLSGRSFYIHEDGVDTNVGTEKSPWRTIAKLNEVDFEPGDTLHFQGGGTFAGTLQLDSIDSGNESLFVVLTSYGEGKASIRGGNEMAIILNQANYVSVQRLHLVGSGRKEGNTANGMEVRNSVHIVIDSLEIEGFQKSGLWVNTSSHVQVNRVHAHENGAAGISISGSHNKEGCREIYVSNCLAENNPGDPTNLTNHSGNGIIAGNCRKVTIEYCAATNNGWDMPRIGNGPVGIWAYEADSLIIQHCVSYRNKTSKGGEDGGGFDLDGGMTNSIIQYCLSYENDGSGFGIFQYNEASPWKNNIIRFNISENDGLISTAHAGIYIWNGSKDENQFTDCFIYNNVIYNAPGTAIRFAEDSRRKAFFYYNNIFVAKDELLKGLSVNDTFLGNNWWSLTGGGFNINGVKNFNRWIEQTGQERRSGEIKGMNTNPYSGFENYDVGLITTPLELTSFSKYKLRQNSLLRAKGVDLNATFGIETGSKDFNQNLAPAIGIGASF